MTNYLAGPVAGLSEGEAKEWRHQVRADLWKQTDGGSAPYYNLPDGAVDLQDLIEHKHMNFSVGNIFKASYRLGEKEGTKREYDLEKIVWFAQRELALIKKPAPEDGDVDME